MEQIAIWGIVGLIVGLPAGTAAGCAVRPGSLRLSRFAGYAWRLRALTGSGLLLYAWLAEGKPPVEWSLTIWSDESLPDLSFSFHLDRVAAVWLAWETLLSACVMWRWQAVAHRRVWLFAGLLVSIADLFVLSSNLLLTLSCGVAISRLCETMRRNPAEQEVNDDARLLLRWGEGGLWITLLLTWQWFGTGDYGVLNDPKTLGNIAADNPAAVPVIGLCLIWTALVFARQFPFLLIKPMGLPDARQLPFNVSMRRWLVWPLGFWLLYRLPLVWQAGVDCQLLGLAGAATALLSVTIAAVATDRRLLFSYASAARFGLIAMLFAMGTERAIFAGWLLILFDAAARLLVESQLDVGRMRSRRVLLVVSLWIVAVWGCAGCVFLWTELARPEGAIERLGLVGFPAAVFELFPWIVVLVIAGECWSLLRWAAISHARDRRSEAGHVGPALEASHALLAVMTIVAGVGSTFFPDRIQLEDAPANDASLVAIVFSGVAIAAVAVWLLYGLNPEWRIAMRKRIGPALSLLRRGAFLPNVWRLLVWRPVGAMLDLCRFCDERVGPAVGRFAGRVTAACGDSFFRGLEHQSARTYGLAVLLTTVVMLGLLLYPEW